MTRYYKYNHQIFKVVENKPAEDRYFIYHDTKKDWVPCMMFQQINLLGAIKRKRASEIKEHALFVYML